MSWDMAKAVWDIISINAFWEISKKLSFSQEGISGKLLAGIVLSIISIVFLKRGFIKKQLISC